MGTVYDDALDDELRVTIVATGLGSKQPASRPQPKSLSVVMPVSATGTDDSAPAPDTVDYNELDRPAVIRHNRAETIEAMRRSGVEVLDIPAFLRKQAD
jgi:cell division protein FtsZ